MGDQLDDTRDVELHEGIAMAKRNVRRAAVIFVLRVTFCSAIVANISNPVLAAGPKWHIVKPPHATIAKPPHTTIAKPPVSTIAKPPVSTIAKPHAPPQWPAPPSVRPRPVCCGPVAAPVDTSTIPNAIVSPLPEPSQDDKANDNSLTTGQAPSNLGHRPHSVRGGAILPDNCNNDDEYKEKDNC